MIRQDARHQVLFSTLDMLSDPATAHRASFKLRDYTENHFSVEEGYIEVLEYPDRDRHVQAHNKLRIEVLQPLEQGDEQGEMFREIISRYLTEWLTRHVFGIDKALEDFILRSNAR